MKTLSEAVQVAIISEAGSTYRNFVLTALRDNSFRDHKEITNAAKGVVSVFVESMTAKLTETQNYTIVNQLTTNVDTARQAFISENIKSNLNSVDKRA